MYKNNNPLNINIKQRNQGFQKKQNVQIFEDNGRVSEPQNQILNTTNDSFNRSLNLSQTLDNTFLLNQISSNQRLLDKLTQKLHDSIMEKSFNHTQEFVDRRVQKLMKQEMSEFKVQLTDFLAKFIKKQDDIDQETQITALKKEIQELRNQSIQAPQNNTGITEEKSQILDKEILYIKSNLEVLKANIQDIKENESILEDKINAQLQTMNMASSQLDCILKRELKDLRLGKNYKGTLRRTQNTQIKCILKRYKIWNSKQQQVDQKLYNVNESQDNLKKEINQYFNLDEQNFSAINLKDFNQESEMFDIKNLNSQLGQSLMRNQNVISSKKESQFTNDYGFMESKEPSDKQPYIPMTTIKNQQNLNPIKEESFQSTASKQSKNLMRLNQSQLKESQLDITVNDQSVLEYIVDESGYLVDQNGFPIIDDNGKAIKLNDQNIEYLKSNKLYEEVYED